MKQIVNFHTFLLVGLLVWACSPPKQNQENQRDTTIRFRNAVEFIAPEGVEIDTIISSIVGQDLTVYSWKNHSFVYGTIDDLQLLENSILAVIDSVKIIEYKSPLYAFDRRLHCADSSVVNEWKDYLLTANLVDDSVMQQEYMAYHNTQFEEWPEIAQGFCNASFQQLLVFKTGRQLLLVISIPLGEDLDDLNPKTVENNPRVDEWNAIMSDYQTGISGTEPDEVWVFLEDY